MRRCRDCNLTVARTADRCWECYADWRRGPIRRAEPEAWDGIDQVAVERLMRGEKVKATEAEKHHAAATLGVVYSTIYKMQKAAS
jgi:hypothetical protein